MHKLNFSSLRQCFPQVNKKTNKLTGLWTNYGISHNLQKNNLKKEGYTQGPVENK